MLRVDRNNKQLVQLKQQSLPDAGWKERDDLQQMIKNSPDAFFNEMGEKLLLIGEEIRPADFVDDRIDLLALDQDGSAVVIELKRGANKLQLLQALSYAAMVSKWEVDRVYEERLKLTGQPTEDVESEIEEFITESIDNVNAAQRIILMAEGFDYEVLATAEWLTDYYEMDIRCYRLKLSAEESEEFLSCTCIYPPPELTDHAIRRGRTRIKRGKQRWADWDEAISVIENPAVQDFYRTELESGRENHISQRELYFRVNGKRRFFTGARKTNVYVWQEGRFLNDAKLWEETLGKHIKVQPVKDDTCLRFYLSTVEELRRFKDTVLNRLNGVEFSTFHASDDEEMGEE